MGALVGTCRPEGATAEEQQRPVVGNQVRREADCSKDHYGKHRCQVIAELSRGDKKATYPDDQAQDRDWCLGQERSETLE